MKMKKFREIKLNKEVVIGNDTTLDMQTFYKPIETASIHFMNCD